MGALVVYLIKSALLLSLLVSLFMLFMSSETFHRTNRFLMLSVMALAMLLPLVNVGIDTPFGNWLAKVEGSFTPQNIIAEQSADESLPALGMDEALLMLPLDIKETDTVSVAENVVQESIAIEEVSWWVNALLLAYLIGVVLLIFRQLAMYIQVVCLITRSRVADASLYGCKGISLRVHSGKEKPFSWFRWVVVSEEDLNGCGREILTHETAHVHACHSLDIVLADVVIIFQWFNPLAWIMKSCLKDIHEFEADEAVINSGVNAKQYQLLIIKKAVGARLYSIANSFNHSLTKKRITMMCKEKSKKWRCAKALYIVPVASIAALSFSTVNDANATESETLFKGSEIIANEAKDVAENYVKATDVADDEKVYQVCETAPEFPGGIQEMMNFLADNVKYPAEARDAGKEGRSIVKFIVNKDGTIGDAEIVKSAGDASLDGEAVRVVSSMPKWNPGMQGGKPVKVQFMLPVAFKLNTKHGPAIESAESNVDAGIVGQAVISIDGVAVKAALTELPDSSVAIQGSAKLSIVIDGKLYEGNKAEAWEKLKSQDIEDITVCKIDALTAGDIIKYKAEGKDGVMFITLKKQSVEQNSTASIVEMGGDGGVSLSNPDDDYAIVIGGTLYVGKIRDIKAEDVESITVVPIEKLSGQELEKCRQLGKKGVVYIEKKKYNFNTLGGSEAVFQVCEQQPVFPGGEDELMKWLSGNIRYPEIARDVNAEGKVYVSFVVKADGTVTDVKAVHSEYSSKNTKVSDAMNLEAHLLRCQGALNFQETELRNIESDIAKWERESKVLEEDGVAEVVLERRREELEKARVFMEDTKKRIARARIELREAHEMFAAAKSELSEVVVTAYKNSNDEPLTGEELLELEKTALVALCDEAERVVKSMPEWQPGMQGGKAVNVRHTLPVLFRLQ